MKQKLPVILTAVITAMLVSGGAVLAYSVHLEKLKEEWIGKVDMHYGQMDANTGSYIIARLEDYQVEKTKEFNKEMEKYLQEVSSEDAIKLMEEAEKEIEKGKKEIDKEFDKLSKEIKKYIDNKLP